jgi:hypothetical protein
MAFATTTIREESLLHEAILTRITTIKKLMESWENYPDQHSAELINFYSRDLTDLQSLEKKLLTF